MSRHTLSGWSHDGALMLDLFAVKAALVLPEHPLFQGRVHGAELIQLRRTTERVECGLTPLAHAKFQGFRAETSDGVSIAIIDKDTTSALGCDSVLRVPDA